VQARGAIGVAMSAAASAGRLPVFAARTTLRGAGSLLSVGGLRQQSVTVVLVALVTLLGLLAVVDVVNRLGVRL
jgi:hypothetical protein